MPGLSPVTGIFGKVPAHGDFVRRGLPTSFVAPWDAWLQAGIAHARDNLGVNWPAAWDHAPAWRFLLPAGACGPDAVAGVMLPSEDTVGRRFPITLAALLPAGMAPPAPEWFDALEQAALAGRHGQADADALAGAVPVPGAPLPPLPAAIVTGAESAPARPGAAADVPGLLAPATSPAEPDRAVDDVLGLLAADGASMPAAAATEKAPRDGVLAILAGTAAVPGPDPSPPSDVLSLFSAEPGPAPAPSAEPDEDRTLAFLTGAAGGWGGDAAAPPPAEATAFPAGWPPEPHAAAPPGPEGGGWWTRGAARVPPMVWPLPGLPSPAQFAYLLEAEA